MTRTRLKITTFLLLFGLLIGSGYEQAAAQDAAFVRLPLSQKFNGIDGYLELRKDARLTSQLSGRLWGTGGIDIGDDPDLEMFKSKPPRNAVIQVVDQAGKVLEAKILERPLAKLRMARLYGDFRLTFLLTVDYSAGSGSYNGPITSLVEVNDGRLRWVEATDVRTGKSGKISLMESLKTTWRLVSARDGKGTQILFAQCRPDWSSVKDDPDFKTTYARIYFDGSKWLVTKRTVKGITEFDQDFPSRKHFP